MYPENFLDSVPRTVIVASWVPGLEGLNWTVTVWGVPCAIASGKPGAGCSE